MACIAFEAINPILNLPQNGAPRGRVGQVGELALGLAHLPSIYLWDWYQTEKIENRLLLCDLSPRARGPTTPIFYFLGLTLREGRRMKRVVVAVLVSAVACSAMAVVLDGIWAGKIVNDESDQPRLYSTQVEEIESPEVETGPGFDYDFYDEEVRARDLPSFST